MNRYKSVDGFFKVPLRRGFEAIREIFDALQQIKHQTNKDCFICGGYARYCASPNDNTAKAGDIDIYSEDIEVFNFIKERLLKDFALSIKDENPMALSLSAVKEGYPFIQLIKPENQGAIVSKGTVGEILSNFDFTVIRIAIISPTECLADADFLHDEENTLLRIKKIHCPISSTLRCMKYAKKGYFLTPSECMKLFDDWMNRTPEYRTTIVETLKEISNGKELTQDEIFNLEKLMRID